MPRRTHRMIAANPTVVDNGVMTQANSLTAVNLQRMVSFEDSLPSTTVTDIKKAATFVDNAVDTDLLIEAGGDAHSIRFGSESGSIGATCTWDAPGANDWLYFAVIRAIEDPSTPGSGFACYIEPGIANDVSIFPYAMRFRNIDSATSPIKPVYTKDLTGEWTWLGGGDDPGYPQAGQSGWHCDNCSGWNLIDGDVYSIGGCKRGDWMEHYFDGRLVGKINVADFAAEHGLSTGRWDDWTPESNLEVSHSGWSGVGCSSSELATVGHWPAEYYGLMHSIFAGGCPDDIEAAMQWMKTEWIAGNKQIWPGWVSI